jgi:CHAT domain-containing protein/tetratricopeptide (TPR) repeat protein
MFLRTGLLAIGALSTCLLQGLKVPTPAAPTRLTRQEARATPSIRVLFKPPTQKLVTRQLKTGFIHVYPLHLKAGERVEVVALQNGVDLRAALFDPSGQHLFTVDNPTGSFGRERILWVAQMSGSYRIDISCTRQGEVGAYTIWVDDEGPAAAKDEKDARAESLFYQAKEEKESLRALGLEGAEEKLQRAVLLWEDIGNTGRQADALSMMGVFYASQSKWKDALQEFDRARTLYQRLGRTVDEGKANNSIGYIQEQHQDLISAQNSFKRALDCGERGHDQGVIAGAHENLGIILHKRGWAEEALDFLQRAQREWRGINPEKEAETLCAVGEVFAAEGKWTSAKAKYLECLAVAESGQDLRNKALALQGMGKIYLKTNNPGQALRSFEGALAIQRQAGLTNEMPNSLNGMADALLNEKRPVDAVVPFKEALRIFEKQADTRNQARVLTNLGWTYARLFRERDAQASYERALILAKGLDLWTMAGATLGLAKLEESRGNPIAAQRQAEASVKYVEDLRTVAGRSFRISFFSTKQDSYDALIEILLWEHSLKPAAGYDAQALRVSEQARSRGLLDSVSAVPSTASSKPSFSAPILSLQEIQPLLDPNTLLLEYYLGRKSSYLWVVGSNSYRVVKLPSLQLLEGRISSVCQLLPISHHRERSREAKRAARDLSRALLGPVASMLEQKRLLISAPGALQSVSFGALPDPNSSDSLSDAKAWPKPLFVEHEIIRIPSASVGAAIHSRAAHRPRPKGRLAFLGDSVTDDRDERLAGIVGGPPKGGSKKIIQRFPIRFERLKSTEDEGNAILKEAGLRGVWGAFGFDATRELVVSGQLNTFGTIHFATHGLVQPNDASRSALVLSLWDRQGNPINGFLEAADIYSLDLSADLVVLSACDTGLGEHIPGEGIVGLSQAFMGAGATRVMVSLWPVEDRATFRLMSSFYHEYLSSGLSPSLALRKAQIAMWKDSNQYAPFYWGGFEIQGDWRWVRDPR